MIDNLVLSDVAILSCVRLTDNRPEPRTTVDLTIEDHTSRSATAILQGGGAHQGSREDGDIAALLSSNRKRSETQPLLLQVMLCVIGGYYYRYIHASSASDTRTG
jgi:hypothetical protein